jgi:hypothetical protein
MAVVVPIGLIAVSTWLLLAVRPRQRAIYAAHPERRPSMRNLVLRVMPFAVLGVVCAVLLGGFWLLLLPVMLIAFAWDIRRRWNPPSEDSLDSKAP